MIELLALPAWDAPPRTLDEWTTQLAAAGQPARVVRDEDNDTWVEMPGARLRGLIEFDGPHVEAINFELNDPDPEPATRLLEAAARALNWEVYPEDEIEDSSEI